MKVFTLYIVYALVLFSHSYAQSQKKDFGATGIKGLNTQQLAALSKGDIVFLSKEDKSSKHTLTEAAIVFSCPPEKAWNLISKTEEQANYIDGCLDIKVISKSIHKSHEVHKVGNMLVTYHYGVIQSYFPESKSLYWTLDTSYPENDLETLDGYWQLYSYGKGKTLARYGSSISIKSVPQFVENKLKKSGVKDALSSVKKYVDSGGTYHK